MGAGAGRLGPAGQAGTVAIAIEAVIAGAIVTAGALAGAGRPVLARDARIAGAVLLEKQACLVGHKEGLAIAEAAANDGVVARAVKTAVGALKALGRAVAREACIAKLARKARGAGAVARSIIAVIADTVAVAVGALQALRAVEAWEACVAGGVRGTDKVASAGAVARACIALVAGTVGSTVIAGKAVGTIVVVGALVAMLPAAIVNGDQVWRTRAQSGGAAVVSVGAAARWRRGARARCDCKDDVDNGSARRALLGERVSLLFVINETYAVDCNDPGGATRDADRRAGDLSSRRHIGKCEQLWPKGAITVGDVHDIG